MSVLSGLGLSAFADPSLGGGAMNTPSTSFGGGSGSSSSSSSSHPDTIPGMMGVYSQLLGLNQQNYGNVLNAYQQGQGNLGQQLPGIYGGYGAVQGQVENTLGMGQVLGQNGNWGVAAPAAQAIGQAYQQNQANTTQQMTNAGLGNTTVGANLQNQNTLGAAQAYGGLGAQLAQTAAGYQAQIGQAGLGARMQGLQAQTGLYGDQGKALAGYNFQNTAGALSGQYTNSSSQSQQQQQQQSQGGQQVNPNANPATSGNGAQAPNLGGGGYPPGPTSFTPGASGTTSSAPAPGSAYSPGFSSGSGPLNSSGYPQTTGIQGDAGVTGQHGLQPGQSSGSVNPQTGYSQGFSQNAYGPPTTGFSGGVGQNPYDQGGQNGLTPELQAEGVSRVSEGVSAQPPYAGAEPLYGREGNKIQADGSTGNKVLIGWQ